MKVSLIVPKWPAGSLWGRMSFRFPYLALTTLAALTDDTWDIEIIDENVQDIDYSRLPDLAAISIMTPLAKRGYQIADRFREKGVPVVVGGIVPDADRDTLAAAGVAAVLGPGASAEDVVTTVRNAVASQRDSSR